MPSFNKMQKNLAIVLLSFMSVSAIAAEPTKAHVSPQIVAQATSPKKVATPAPATMPVVPAMPAMNFPMPSKKDHPANTMTTTVSREAKTMMMQSMMAASPLSVRELVAMMVTKHKVKPGVKFDEVIESLKLVANKNNFKYTGVSLLSQDVTATTGKPTPRVEILSFCDSVVARSVIDYAPELIAFLPCRVSVLEDANKDIWIVSLDWDISWMNLSKNPNNMDENLWKESVRIRKVMDEMMEAAANGDF